LSKYEKTLLIALICIYAIYVCKSHVKPVIFCMGLGFTSLKKKMAYQGEISPIMATHFMVMAQMINIAYHIIH